MSSVAAAAAAQSTNHLRKGQVRKKLPAEEGVRGSLQYRWQRASRGCAWGEFTQKTIANINKLARAGLRHCAIIRRETVGAPCSRRVRSADRSVRGRIIRCYTPFPVPASCSPQWAYCSAKLCLSYNKSVLSLLLRLST